MTADPATTVRREPDAHEAARRAALDAAVRFLGRREYGRRELARKLRAKGHADAQVEAVLDYLAEHDLQSDERYVDAYCRSRTRRGYGPLKIRQELASRGIDETDVERGLTASAEFWMEQAHAALGKRGASHRGALHRGASHDDDSHDDGAARDEWNARARFLARRGFPSDLISRVLGGREGG